MTNEEIYRAALEKIISCAPKRPHEYEDAVTCGNADDTYSYAEGNTWFAAAEMAKEAISQAAANSSTVCRICGQSDCKKD